jgi:hypothetical protein
VRAGLGIVVTTIFAETHTERDRDDNDADR